MASHFLDIAAALDGHLEDMVGSPPVSWQNVEFTPTIGTTYIRPTLMPGDSVPETFDDDMNIGVYQIDIFVEAGASKVALYEMADTLADRFKVDTQLTYNGVTVQIKTVSQKAAINNDDGWYQMPIEIVYYAFTARR